MRMHSMKSHTILTKHLLQFKLCRIHIHGRFIAKKPRKIKRDRTEKKKRERECIVNSWLCLASKLELIKLFVFGGELVMQSHIWSIRNVSVVVVC